MPTEAFHLLDDKRKQALLQAATKEFESLPYDKVSIFKIARNAGISRSGLYYYFKDKKDIYCYLLTDLQKQFADTLHASQRRHDLFTIYRDNFVFLAGYKGTNKEKLLRQVLADMRSSDMQTLFAPPRLQDIESIIDMSALRIHSADEVLGLGAMLRTIASALLVQYLNGDTGLEAALARLDRYWDLLKYGFVDGGRTC